MTDHHDLDDAPDLVGLLTGDLSRDDALTAAAHLETCSTCTTELIDLAVANAALRSAELVDRMLDEPVEPLPPLTAPLDEAPADGLGEPAPVAATGRGPRRRPRTWVVAAAAVVVTLLVATVAVVAVGHRRGVGTAVASAPLHTLQAPSGATGSVAVFAQGSTRTLRVAARQLPQPADRYFYEVWLLDPATQKMLPMGVLSPSGNGQYSVSASIMDGYSAVDVSLQANDGNPAHSQTSVLRATL